MWPQLPIYAMLIQLWFSYLESLWSSPIISLFFQSQLNLVCDEARRSVCVWKPHNILTFLFSTTYSTIMFPPIINIIIIWKLLLFFKYWNVNECPAEVFWDPMLNWITDIVYLTPSFHFPWLSGFAIRIRITMLLMRILIFMS